MNDLEKEMTIAARDLLGSGCIMEYYRQAAGDFIHIAQNAIDEAYKRGRKDGQQSASAQKVVHPKEVNDVFG